MVSEEKFVRFIYAEDEVVCSGSLQVRMIWIVKVGLFKVSKKQLFLVIIISKKVQPISLQYTN